ncbi:MAG: FUN14 domain-containing protein [Trueperaceae bacterium]|nr:FUN14 domain-containing protein [Trueperaceae bacterium]
MRSPRRAGEVRTVLRSLVVDVPDLSSVLPALEQLGFGAVAGFVAGYALKKVGKLAAVVVGLFFVGVQLLAWAGYLTIEWGRVRAEVEPLLAPSSLNEAWHALVSVLTYNVPFAAAFVPGFLLGMRRG